MHMLLSSLGYTAYHELVPLRIQTFSLYSLRCPTSLVRRLHLATDARKGRRSCGGLREADGQVTANAVMLAIQSRLQYPAVRMEVAY
ncbi:hypothetical protein L207DRAFT_613546 [Hyaloscypha variabilis F]|uniref:Uncharacterized protein n=1 Tax=Hyaloscypha variabilis (strain UAMH 11265 / GT02V1 / F) TaxID=1149755 RepID=A0A2J6S7S1_HYAVF|nr:hypothetical protein L207DRAFT_613546 [Hyaloscypha variabilis F]